ncbi:hypothetical protein WJ23_31815 [Burkholderia lata]|nr:hypothetical protein WJ23_31815 [Burkholderia lata]
MSLYVLLLFRFAYGSIQHCSTDYMVSRSQQSIARASRISAHFVLSQLAFSDEAGDFDFESNETLNQLIDIVRRRITHFPWSGLGRFVRTSQSSNYAPYKFFVVMEPDATVRVDHDVVPRRDLPVGFLFSRIPTRRDVCVTCLKGHKHLIAIRYVSPKRIGTRDMRAENAKFAFSRGEVERKVVGVESVAAVRKQRTERALRNVLVQYTGSGLGEMIGQIHGDSVYESGRGTGTDGFRHLLSKPANVEPIDVANIISLSPSVKRRGHGAA